MAAAKAMAQSHGYNGLSFRVLAQAVGVKSASIHYHFPTKGDLGAALASRYREDAKLDLESLLAERIEAHAYFARYTAIFRRALERDNRMCLCGIMAAEYDDLPEAVKVEVVGFADDNIAWLGRALLRLEPAPSRDAVDQRALAIYAAVGGAQLTARGRGSIDIYDQIIEGYRSCGLLPSRLAASR
jgi:TetR/AcrR family transcriptional regulator, transcriptional repressor for nem operon